MSTTTANPNIDPSIIVNQILNELKINGHPTTQVAQITDTSDRNALLKIHGAYTKHGGRVELHDYQVVVQAAFNTIEIGFAASELFNNQERPDRVIAAVNCAGPDKEEGTHNNARNDFFAAELQNNDIICGTSNGHEFSYVKPHIKTAWRITPTNFKGSQFRSLEVLPEYTMLFSVPAIRERLIRTGLFERIENVDDIIPSPPSTTHVVEIDNFRNAKLYLSPQDRELLKQREGKTVEFAFGKKSLECAPDFQGYHWGRISRVAPTLFAAPLGTNVLALKSSSSLSGGASVPILATIRKRPGETGPRYHVPAVGVPVRIIARDKARLDIVREFALDSLQNLKNLPAIRGSALTA